VLGGFVGGIIGASAGAVHGGRALARIGRGGVLLLAIFMALQELGIATDIVTTAFAILFGAIALGAGALVRTRQRELAARSRVSGTIATAESERTRWLVRSRKSEGRGRVGRRREQMRGPVVDSRHRTGRHCRPRAMPNRALTLQASRCGLRLLVSKIERVAASSLKGR